MGRSVAGVLLKGDTVFVARRVPGGEMGGRWEFPGGKVEEGESDQEALVREFLEEFEADIRVLEPLGETSFLHRGQTRQLAAWWVELLPGTRLVLHEHVEFRWMSMAGLAGLDFADSDRKLIDLVRDLSNRMQGSPADTRSAGRNGLTG